MQAAETWRSLFETWPDAMPRKGALVTSHGESIPFIDFMISSGILLVERDGPDAAGNRKVMLHYQAISAVKLATSNPMSQFQSMGFQRPV